MNAFEKPALGTFVIGDTEYAIVPLAELEQLRAEAARRADDYMPEEDAEDIAAARAALEAIARGEETIPGHVVFAAARGESTLRAARKWRGLTQKQLAEAVGVAQGYISDIESGRRTGQVATLRALAQALRVPLELLVLVDEPAAS